MRTDRIILAVHGGAGFFESGQNGGEIDAARRELSAILTAGYEALQRGSSAVEAVLLAVRMLEDCELFNAGRGSVLTASETVEMDAAIMDGCGRKAGAVAGVCCIKNPVSAAHAVMQHSEHVLLIGSSAERYARRMGVETADTAYFITPQRKEELARVRKNTVPNASNDAGHNCGTVGAVARDNKGHLAAATSTGGITNKLPGRVGDTPIIGAGTWADDSTCAVSATGHGESFVRAVFAHEVHALMRHSGLSLSAACEAALNQVRSLGGTGGCVAVDARGNFTMPFTSELMYRGWIDSDGKPDTAVLRSED